MDALRVVVDDVDAALVAFEAAGYSLAQRWGPPFAVLSGRGADVWLSGPGTSAARSLDALDDADAAAASVRPVLDVTDVGATVAALTAAGWTVAGELVSGPGGTQQLLRRGPVFLEVFSSG